MGDLPPRPHPSPTPKPPSPVGHALDVHESVASVVLQRVEAVQDRLALACVSRVWRRVATAPSCWAPHDVLQLEGDLASKLTDDRLSRLFPYAGPALRSIVIHDAPAAFTGKGLSPLLSTFSILPLSNLKTLDLSRCPGVRGQEIITAMLLSGVMTRVKEKRLDKISVAGCDVTASDVTLLYDYVRHARPRPDLDDLYGL
jgi:hypothetical protein